MESPNGGDPLPILDEWCCGFMKGVSLDPTGWLLVTAGKPDWMSTIILYGTEDGWDRLKKKDHSLDEHRVLAGGLADTIHKIYALFKTQRLEGMSQGSLPHVMRREPMRNPDKVGRNDLCPCDSGKKFKHCHGSPERLH